MRYRTILFWTLILALLGMTSLCAQCPATATPGQFISFQLSATAPDNPNSFWLISPDYMTANPAQGNHNTTISGSIPSNATGSVTIQASYNNGSSPSPLYTFSCTIQIASPQPLQINGSCPANSYSPGDPVSVPFSASGGNTQQYVWSVTPPFFVSPQTGPNTSVLGNAPSGSTTFQVTLSENAIAGNSSKPAAPVSRTCQIVVNQNTPLQINGSCPANSFLPNDPISIPFTASGGNTKQYIWNVTAPFSVSPATGASTTVLGNAPQSTTSFTLTLSEAPPMNTSAPPAAAPVTKTCQIVVVAPLGITGTCPAARIAPGVPVSIPLAGSGGSGNYMWVINPTNIGLSLNSSTGSTTTVQGTPAAGQYTFTVTLSDNTFTKLTPATFQCTITIAGSVSITGTCPTQPIVTGVSFSLPLTVTGGIGPYTWVVKADPLTPSSLTGATITLSGTPTTTTDITVSVTVQDSSSQAQQASFRCVIRVVNPLTITGPPCPITQLQGKTVTAAFSGSGGSGNYSWTLAGPGFLSLTSGTGASTSVTGIASDAGTFPFTVNLADDIKTPLTAPFSCSVQVIATLTVGPTNFPDGFVGQAYPATTVNVSGGIPPYIIRVSKGPLPPGLVIDSATGTVTGTPTQTGTFPFTVTVTDTGTNVDNRQIASADYQIRITAPLQNTTSCPLPTGTELQPYNAPLTATGGTGQYTFSLSGTSLLPPGLVLDQNAITGTPQGPFPSTPLNFQLASGGQTVNFTCAIAVLGRKPTVTVTGLFTNTGSQLVTSSVTLSVPVQEDVKGTALLTFTPDVPNAAIKDNPQVQFCGGNAGDPLCGAAQKDPTNLLRLVPFTVRAGLASADLPPLVTSNVAGTIQIALNNLTVGPQTITAAPLRFTLPRSAPAILSTPQVSRSGQNIQIVLKVAASTCELTSAAAVFTATPGSQLDGASSTTSLSSLFQNFAPGAIDSTHPIGGCAFTLTLPYSISGDPSVILTVSVTLTNSVGSTSTAALPVQ
jgi:hypothetical protein